VISKQPKNQEQSQTVFEALQTKQLLPKAVEATANPAEIPEKQLPEPWTDCMWLTMLFSQ
jgi:hypothetical protein